MTTEDCVWQSLASKDNNSCNGSSNCLGSQFDYYFVVLPQNTHSWTWKRVNHREIQFFLGQPGHHCG